LTIVSGNVIVWGNSEYGQLEIELPEEERENSNDRVISFSSRLKKGEASDQNKRDYQEVFLIYNTQFMKHRIAQ